MAFQKLRGLARTGRVDAGLWRLLSHAGIPRARVPRGTHIEVSKTKQVMFEVVNGKVARVVARLDGRHREHAGRQLPRVLPPPGLQREGDVLLALLPRGFAIHGYASVPAYQASHGCVRTPIWYAYGFWTALGAYRHAGLWCSPNLATRWPRTTEHRPARPPAPRGDLGQRPRDRRRDQQAAQAGRQLKDYKASRGYEFVDPDREEWMLALPRPGEPGPAHRERACASSSTRCSRSRSARSPRSLRRRSPRA